MPADRHERCRQEAGGAIKPVEATMICTSPLPVSDRALALLRCVGHCGPLYFKQIQRALPAFAPELRARRSHERLLYRELGALVKRRWLGRRRPHSSRAAAYYLTEKGAGLVEARGHGRADLGTVDRFFSKPAHDEILHGLVIELILAKAQPNSPLAELAWSHAERYELETPGEAKPKAYVPDAVLWLTLADRREFTILVEVDRGTETLTYWVSKVLKAGQLLTGCGASGMLLVVAEGERRLRSLLEATQAVFEPDLMARTRWIETETFNAEAMFDQVFLGWDCAKNAMVKVSLLG